MATQHTNRMSLYVPCIYPPRIVAVHTPPWKILNSLELVHPRLLIVVQVEFTMAPPQLIVLIELIIPAYPSWLSTHLTFSSLKPSSFTHPTLPNPYLFILF